MPTRRPFQVRQTRERTTAVCSRPPPQKSEIPPVWECRLHGLESKIMDGNEPEQKKIKAPRTHWDMLLERRSIPELEELLTERLEELKGRRTRTA